MEVRTARTDHDIAAASRLDALAMAGHARVAYIAQVAERGGLKLACACDRTVGFCCLDERYFFEKAFVSLLIVDPDRRRRGVGTALLRTVAADHIEAWTSTNRSNLAMRNLLHKMGWNFCGELDGLDPGDPEMFFKSSV